MLLVFQLHCEAVGWEEGVSVGVGKENDVRLLPQRFAGPDMNGVLIDVIGFTIGEVFGNVLLP